MEYLNYHLFKMLINNLDDYIKNKFEYEDTDILSYISFKSIPNYYSKKDKYGMIEKFNSDKFNDFIVECAINLDKENDFNNLLFLYGLIISDTSSKLLLKNVINNENINNYISLKYDIKFDLDYYKNNNKKILNYTDKMEDLVHNPLIRIFDLFASYYYFIRGYKKYKKNFKKEINKNKSKDLSLDNISFEENGIKNIDDYITYIYETINIKIKALNLYLFEQNDKNFREEFNINKEKKV